MPKSFLHRNSRLLRRVLIFFMMSNGNPLLWADEATPPPHNQSVAVEKVQAAYSDFFAGQYLVDTGAHYDALSATS